jgi:hypothetical protein
MVQNAGMADDGFGGAVLSEWCARAFTGAPSVAGRLPSEPDESVGRHAERALALRMGALVQPVPAYRVLRGRRPQLVDRVQRYFAAYATVGVVGAAGPEKGLARLCLLLARLEADGALRRGATVEQLHRSIPDDDVLELVDLAGKVPGALGARLDPSPGPLGVAEPVFGPGRVPGDLTLGGTLIAVTLGDHAELARRLRQLVTLAWLDVEDRHRVRELGVYLAATGTLATWSVADLAAELLAGADPDAARAEFRALATAKAQRQPTVYGPEVWKTVAGTEWTYWDLWFCAVCVRDHGGDWDALDAKLSESPYREFSARMWSHILDVERRLAAAGISAADLAGPLVRDRKTMTKARSKVVQWIGIDDKHRSPAMRDTPEDRFAERAHFGGWDPYPVSPRPSYHELIAAATLDLEEKGWRHRDVQSLFKTLEELEARHAGDPATLLAVRRAGLTASSIAHHNCGDSGGFVSDYTSDATLRFSRTDWRAAGIDAAGFWRDFLEVFVMLSNFGVAYDREGEVWANLGVERDLELVERLIDELHGVYVAGRLKWHASELERFREQIRPAA